MKFFTTNDKKARTALPFPPRKLAINKFGDDVASLQLTQFFLQSSNSPAEFPPAFMFQPLEESSLGFRLRPARARVYAFGLFRCKGGNGLIDYRFVLSQSLATGWADRKVFLQPLLFFLAEMA